MSADVQSLLQSALGGSYRIERELLGGAMSRVFLATETALGRRVVVKVVPPELSGQTPFERFRREIQLAASLQHPNIVPLLTSGEANGALYYTAPYVAGESLRARLQRERQLPIDDAVRLAREIALAIDYAHRQGVVHRDVKPDNVLVSDGHAVLTDFGIARALRAEGAESLTGTGLSLGTPAYIAPEQASGERDVDGRADLYALGCVLFEMLAGQPPYAGPTSQSLVAQHVAAPIPSVRVLRPAVPQWLDAVVRRAMAKNPVDRFATGEALAQSLAAGRDRRESGSLLRSRGARAVVVTLAAATVVLALWVRLRPTSDLNPRRLVVAPFENRSGDAALEGVGALASEYLTQSIRETGLLDVVEPPRDSASAERSDAAALGLRVGAKTVVVVGVFRLGDSVRLNARLLDASSREVVRTVTDVAAPLASPMPAINLLRQRVLGALATTVDSTLSQFASIASQPPTMEAYQDYVAAREAHLAGDNRAALSHAYHALALDSTFTLPYVVAAFAHQQLGECATTDSLARALEPRRALLPVFDRLQVERAVAGCRGDDQRAYEAARALRRFAPYSQQIALATANHALALGRAREAVALMDSLDPLHPALRGSRAYFTFYSIALHLTGDFVRASSVAADGLARFEDDTYLLGLELGAIAASGRTGEVFSRIRRLESSSALPDSAVGEAMNWAFAELQAHGHASEARAMAERERAWCDRHSSRTATAGWIDQCLATTLIGAERWGDALPYAERLFAALPEDTSQIGRLGVIAAHLNRVDVVERVNARLATVSSADAFYWRALVAAHLGDKASAARLLREAMGHGFSFNLIWPLHSEPLLEPLRGYAPFQALVTPKG